tara:strand:+ start:260 stop:406 length:147 start_codon:yes stop_codon:yes gene_type:complete
MKDKDFYGNWPTLRYLDDDYEINKRIAKAAKDVAKEERRLRRKEEVLN